MRPVSGRSLRRGAHLLALLPLVSVIGRAGLDQLGANPIETAVRALGDWALVVLLVALAVTPLRRFLPRPWSLACAPLRRLFGLWAFAYAALHVAAYVGLDQFFDWSAIGRDLLKRKYITAGMVAMGVLSLLAATSSAAAIRWLGGRRWKVLHRFVFLALAAALLHFAWMVKADLFWPLVATAVGGALCLLRLPRRTV